MSPIFRGCAAALGIAISWVSARALASEAEPDERLVTTPRQGPLPARSAGLGPVPMRSLPKEPRLEVGLGPLLRSAHVTHELGDVSAGANLSPGVALLARVPIVDVFSMEVVAGWSRMSLDLAAGDFVSGGVVESMLQDTFSFELWMAPAIYAGDRVNVFGLVGVGFLASSIGATELFVGANRAVIADRERWHFSVPVGGGASFQLVPGWLDLGVRLWISPTFGEGGDGSTAGTVYDGAGSTRALAPMPTIPLWITQTATLGMVL